MGAGGCYIAVVGGCAGASWSGGWDLQRGFGFNTGLGAGYGYEADFTPGPVNIPVDPMATVPEGSGLYGEDPAMWSGYTVP